MLYFSVWEIFLKSILLNNITYCFLVEMHLDIIKTLFKLTNITVY